MRHVTQVIELKPSVQETPPSPLFGVAMLRIAMEMKKPGSTPMEEIVGRVLQQMHLPEEGFKDFLKHNGGLLKSITAHKKKQGVSAP